LSPSAHLSSQTPAALLTSISVAEGTNNPEINHWAFTYNKTGTATGTIASLVLPTGGRIEYTYDLYNFPEPSSSAGAPKGWSQNNSNSQGVVTRALFDRDGTFLGSRSIDHDDQRATSFRQEVIRTVTEKGAQSQILQKTRHYFSTCIYQCTNQSAPGEYGLPLSRQQPTSGGMALSTEVLGGSDWTSVMKATYLAYDGDHTLATVPNYLLDENRHVVSQRVKYLDTGVTSDVVYSDFDGLGQYRVTTATGTSGHSDNRTSVTDYNPGVATFVPATFGTAANGVTPTLVTPWLLGLYTYQAVETTEQRPNVSTATLVNSEKRFCFDPTTGFLRFARTLVNGRTHATSQCPTGCPQLLGSDLLAVFTPDGHGNVATEEFVGGDNSPAAPTTISCTSPSLSSNAYRIDHTYVGGTLETTRYVDGSGNGLSFYVDDATIDASTGLASSTRVAAVPGTTDHGLSTTYAYDAFGRLTSVTPSTGAWLEYTYPSVVSVDAKAYAQGALTGSTALTHETYAYDGLGRVISESHVMPSGTTVYRSSVLNHLGWKLAASEWDTSSNPSHKSLFAYDFMGRPTSVVSADGSVATMTYLGATSSSRTIKVATSSTNPAGSDVTTTERVDGQGRLWQIVEPNQTVTEYTYDGGGRLWQVCQNLTSAGCGQVRLFTYDNRGFLLQEQHPEKGATGNGQTTYSAYDARGHLGRRTDGTTDGSFDVLFSYDRAERLTQVSSASGQILKAFSFATSNGASDYRNGRLLSATRINWFPASNLAIKVRESYEYGGIAGRASKRTTDEFECTIGSNETCNSLPSGSPTRTFSHVVTYTDLGAPATVRYPQCDAGCGTVATAPTVTNTYSQGLLTSVAFPSNGSSRTETISYSPSGLVYQVHHDNNVLDQQDPDPSGIARPRSLITTNVTDPSSCTPPSISSQPTPPQPAPANTSVTLSATVASDTSGQHPTTYQWYAGSLSSPIANATSVSLTVAPAVTTTYFLVATNDCGTAQTTPVTVIISCTAPSESESNSPTITRGMSTVIFVSTPDPSPSYQWYVSNGTAVIGAVNAALSVSPSATTSYYATVTTACGSVTSASIVVTVVDPPPQPTAVTATMLSTGAVHVQWANAGLVADGRYELYRKVDGGDYTSRGQFLPSQTSYDDTASVVAGKTYVYRMRTIDSRTLSLWSVPEIATTMTFASDPLGTGAVVRGVDFGDVRAAIDAARLTAGLLPAWTSHAALSGPVTRADMNAMRDALNDARLALAMPTVVFTNAIVPGVVLQAIDVQELRNGVK
jgi:YD repeat-containing protein